MFRLFRGLFRRSPQLLFPDGPIRPVPAPPRPPAWLSTISPARTFTEAEGRAYARSLEHVRIAASERSGESEREAEAETLQHFSRMFSERPR